MTTHGRNPSDHGSAIEQQSTETDQLRDLIGRAGLSQRSAARELGVSDRMMRHWCSGDESPPAMALRAMDPAARHRAILRDTIENNERIIESIQSGIITGLGFGPAPPDADSSKREAQRLKRNNEELHAMLRERDAFERKQQALFALNQQFLPRGNGVLSPESLAEFEAAEAEWRSAQKEMDRIAKEIQSGKRP